MSVGKLFIVATPIGNMQDISLRAIAILEEVQIIACEDTRRTGSLLKSLEKAHHDENAQPKRLISYYEENELQRIPEIVTLLKNGSDVALVSDAGTPAISDPGFKLIRECIKEKIPVESVPGPSSVLTALIVSGLPTDKFFFIGYLPKKSGKRQNYFQDLKDMLLVTKHMQPTVILFEAPHRLTKTLLDVQAVFGDISLVVGRELTKVHEEVVRGTVSKVIAKYDKKPPRGELVILFHLGIQEASHIGSRK